MVDTLNRANKIPFFVVKEFISPLVCERIINDLRVHKTRPNIGQNGLPKKMVLMNKLNSTRLAQTFESYIPSLEKHFNFEYRGTHDIYFEWFPENSKAETPKSDGYAKTKTGWTRYREVDFVGILWLNDYNDEPPFDPSFEAYGGKLEFPTFDISFTPERGTLVVFPSAPNFVYTVSDVTFGSSVQSKFTIRSEVPYNFDREFFDCNPRNWNL